MDSIIDKLVRLIFERDLEAKFLRCQSYRKNSLIKWKKQTGLTWVETLKFVRRIEIFDASRIRKIIAEIVHQNSTVFNSDKIFITSFGGEGKSGGKIAYEFRHTKLVNQSKFIESWRLAELPEGSTIIFVDDLIGTGEQATEYILNKLNLLINPSNKPILLTICATKEGVDKIKDNTNFEIIYGVELTEDSHQYYSSENRYFSRREKEKIVFINNLLKKEGAADYDRGLLIAFHYSTPNNSMPILWKENYQYLDKNNCSKRWYALFPREY